MSIKTTQSISRDRAEKMYVEYMLKRPSFERDMKSLTVLMGLNDTKAQEYIESTKNSKKINAILLAQAVSMSDKELSDELDKLAVECGEVFDNYEIVR